ncbi:MAG: hypothetical protein OJF51_000497 [Nitrospira sp.]|nr:MAG: hypothetical protein OJF51_000497 [Nitrospira sp.]
MSRQTIITLYTYDELSEVAKRNARSFFPEYSRDEAEAFFRKYEYEFEHDGHAA